MFKNPYFSSILVPFKTNKATEHFLRAFIFFKYYIDVRQKDDAHIWIIISHFSLCS